MIPSLSRGTPGPGVNGNFVVALETNKKLPKAFDRLIAARIKSETFTSFYRTAALYPKRGRYVTGRKTILSRSIMPITWLFLVGRPICINVVHQFVGPILPHLD